MAFKKTPIPQKKQVEEARTKSRNFASQVGQLAAIAVLRIPAYGTKKIPYRGRTWIGKDPVDFEIYHRRNTVGGGRPTMSVKATHKGQTHKYGASLTETRGPGNKKVQGWDITKHGKSGEIPSGREPHHVMKTVTDHIATPRGKSPGPTSVTRGKSSTGRVFKRVRKIPTTPPKR